jgi:RNA polymerase sigma factor (sigma-70 family)
VSADAPERPRPVEREYARLVERHRDELHAHSRRILRSSQDAEDALQEALLRAWRALPSFEGRSSLRSWLYRIVTNTSLDVVKGGPCGSCRWIWIRWSGRTSCTYPDRSRPSRPGT